MRKPWILALACVLLLPACSIVEQRDAEARVEMMMEGWRTGGTGSGGDIQEAVSMWWKGVRFIPDELELTEARDEFDRWRRAKGLYKRIDSWEITSTSSVKGAYPPTTVVSVEIDGKSYGMRVAKGETIEWAN